MHRIKSQKRGKSMKKIVTVLVAVMMLLNLSFAMAEETFEDNLAAFLNTLNVENGDVLLALEAGGQTFNVRTGKDDAGVHAALSMGENAMGEAMLTADTAYVSAMGQGMKLQYQTLQNLAQSMLKNVFGEVNISPDQINADLQMLANKLAAQVLPLMQALTTEEVENGVKYSVNSEAFAEGLTGAVDGLLGDEEVAACIDRYAGFLRAADVEVSADGLKEAWAAKKDALKQNLSQSVMSLTVKNDATYAAEVLLPSQEKKVAILSNGSMAEGLESMTTVGYEGEEPEMTMAITINNEEIVYDVKMAEVTVYEKMVLSDSGLKTLDYVISENGETAVEAHYADGKFTMTTPDASITGEITSKEAKKLVATLTAEQNGETQVMTLTVEILDQALACTLDAGAQILMNLSMTEKGAWTDLSQAEGLVEIDENMLMSLLSNVN